MSRGPTHASVRHSSRQRVACLCLGLFVVFVASPVAADAQQWGTIKLRIRCPGVIENDLPPDGSVAIDGKTGALADAFVWVRSDVGDVHPAYGVSDTDQITLEFGNNRIRPRTIVVRKSQTLGFKVVDDQTHSPVFTFGSCGLLPPNTQAPITLPTSKTLPQQVTCAIHPREIAYVKIMDHPYGDATDADGTAEILDLPVGVHELQFWHERAGYLNLSKPNQAAPATVKGRIKVTVKPGVNDLGEFTTDLATFR
jgi:hypothetical protein